MSPSTPCPACGSDVSSPATPDDAGLLRCPACETEFAAQEDVPEAEDRGAEQIASDEPESLPQPLDAPSAELQPDPAILAVWRWAEDGGRVELPAPTPTLETNMPNTGQTPLEIEVELPAVVEGAVGPYLAFSDHDRGTPVNRDRARASRRAARREPGVLSHLVGVVGGGVLGLVIAYYLLNWIGGPQYNFLELNLPGLAGQSTEADDESTAAKTPDWQRFVDQPPSGRLMFEDEPAADDPSATPVPPQPAPEPTDALPPAPPTDGPVGVRDAPKFKTDDLREALHAAQDAASMTPEDFGKLCRLGQVVTFLDEQQQDPNREPRLNAISLLAEKIMRRPGALDQLSKLAAQRMHEHSGPPTGIVLAGAISAVGQQGRLHWCQLTLHGSEETATVVSRLPAPLAPSDHVLVFGSLINDPTSNLAGYEGQLPQVIWGGWHVKLPARDADKPAP